VSPAPAPSSDAASAPVAASTADRFMQP
jgi:hypothetical protein